MIPSQLPTIYLKPGEFRLSKSPEIVVTILGSCVAIIMYDLESGVCASTHCVLPSHKNYDSDCNCENFKYVDTAFNKMLDIYKKLKIPQHKLKVKVFGGAEQLNNNSLKKHSVGKQNVLKALDLLHTKKLDVLSMDVGGNEGRKIYLLSHTGEVLLTRLGKQIK